MYYFKGFSLIEVLISLLLFSLIMLIFNIMMLQIKREVRDLYYTHIAMTQLMQVQEQLVDSNNKVDINEWNKQNLLLLPKGKGEIHVANKSTEILLTWAKGKKPCSSSISKNCVSISLLAY